MGPCFETGFFVQEPAWHGQGRLLESPPATGADARREAGQEWTVQTYNLYHSASSLPLEGHKAIVRYSDMSLLGVHSDKYMAEAPADFLSLTDELVKEGALIHESGGVLNNGKQYWSLLKVADSCYYLDGARRDAANPYLLLSGGYTGAETRRVCTTQIRVVCWNTLSMALASTPALCSRRHVGDWGNARNALMESIAEAVRGREELCTRAGLLSDRAMSRREFLNFTAELYRAPDPLKYAQSPTAAALRYQWDRAGAHPDSALPETRWRALNAVTAFLDRGAPSKRGLPGQRGNMSRIAFNPTIAALRTRAWDLLLAD